MTDTTSRDADSVQPKVAVAAFDSIRRSLIESREVVNHRVLSIRPEVLLTGFLDRNALSTSHDTPGTSHIARSALIGGKASRVVPRPLATISARITAGSRSTNCGSGSVVMQHSPSSCGWWLGSPSGASAPRVLGC